MGIWDEILVHAAAGVTFCVSERAAGVHGPWELAVLAGDAGVEADGKELTAVNTLHFAHISFLIFFFQLLSVG